MESDDIDSLRYSPVSAAKTMHAAPRFGHQRNFSVLFYDNKDDQKDYIFGLIFGACLILGLFLVWAFLLIFFRCLRSSNKFGFLSGAPMVYRKGDPETYGRPFFVRLTFLVCILVFISFSVTLVTRGITRLEDTLTTLVRATDEINTMQDEVDDIIASLEDLKDPTKSMEDRIIDLYGDGAFCPANPTFAADTGYDFDGLLSDVLIFLQEVGEFLGRNVTELDEASHQTADAVEKIYETTDRIELDDWQSLIVLIPYVIIPSFLLVALILAWFDASITWYTSFVKWLLIPLLIIFTTIAFAVAAGVIIAAVANADFCEGQDTFGLDSQRSPDHSIKDLLASTGLTQEDLILRVVEFYVSQCTSDDPFGFLKNYKDIIDSTVAEASTLADAVSSVTHERLTLECGRDFTPLDAILDNLGNTLKIILTNAKAGIELVRCERISVLYSSAVYSGTCTLSVTGVTWVFASSLIVGVSGMLLLTFRSAMWDVVEGEEEVIVESYAMGVPAPYEEAPAEELQTRFESGPSVAEQQQKETFEEVWEADEKGVEAANNNGSRRGCIGAGRGDDGSEASVET